MALFGRPDLLVTWLSPVVFRQRCHRTRPLGIVCLKIRQIASLTDLSLGTTYDLVEALYSTLNLSDDGPTPTTYTPNEFDADEDDLLEEYVGK